jgi:hypothetical protein
MVTAVSCLEWLRVTGIAQHVRLFFWRGEKGRQEPKIKASMRLRSDPAQLYEIFGKKRNGFESLDGHCRRTGEIEILAPPLSLLVGYEIGWHTAASYDFLSLPSDLISEAR